MNRIQILENDAKELVNSLRLKEYSSAKGFHVAPAGILWNPSDDQSYVLGAFEGEKLISTMRMELISDPKLVELKMECPWSFPVNLEFPVAVLSKASTDQDHRSSGLNAALRSVCMSIARFHGVKYFLGTFVDKSPRIHSLKEMGYVFYENTLGWNQENYKSQELVWVCVLDFQKDGKRAQEVCNSLSRETLEKYPWDQKMPPYKQVKVVR